MKKFNIKKYNGLFGESIPHNKVNADLTDVYEGDVFHNSNNDILVFFQEGFKISTIDPSEYLTDNELKLEFKRWNIGNS